jgi:hypothetical protein
MKMRAISWYVSHSQTGLILFFRNSEGPILMTELGCLKQQVKETHGELKLSEAA